MRRRAPSGESRTGRFFGFASIGAVTGMVVFLLVFPTVEREAYLSDLRSDDTTLWPGALLHLCWTRSGVAGIEGALEESSLAHRRRLLRAIDRAGCMQQLAPEHRARHDFETGDIDSFIGYGEEHADIAIQALENGQVDEVRRADRALAAHWPNLDPSRTSRIQGLVENMRTGRAPQIAELLGLDEQQEVVDETRLETMVDAVVGAEHAVRETRALAEALASVEVLPEPDMDLRLPEPSLRAPTRGGPLFSRGADDGESSSNKTREQ